MKAKVQKESVLARSEGKNAGAYQETKREINEESNRESPAISVADFHLTDADRYELNIAALLHDCGKITTPDWVMDKASKLQTVHDRIDEIETRYAVLRQQEELRLFIAQQQGTDLAVAEQQRASQLAAFDREIQTLRRLNKGAEYVSPDDVLILDHIKARRWMDVAGNEQPMLTEDEWENLRIARGYLKSGRAKHHPAARRSNDIHARKFAVSAALSAYSRICRRSS